MKKDFKKVKRNRGAAMLISVIFFLFISLAIISGLVGPTVREFKNANVNLNSKKSYFLAESGGEDALYRILNNIEISESETITLDSNSVTTDIASIGNNQKQIVSLGDVGNLERQNSLLLKTGSGAVFKYGTQAGQGGMTIGNNAGLNGSLYSNGSILGSNHAFITGDAYVANSPALAADQINDTPTPPPYGMVFGTANATQDIAQSFQLTTSGLANKVQFYIKKNGNPGNVTVRITTNNGSAPSTTTITTGTLSATLVTGSYGWVNVTFASSPFLAAGTTYWVVIDNNTSLSNYYTLAGNTGAYANGQAKIGAYSGTWNNTTPAGLDGYFKFYLGGFTSQIDNMEIGTSGVGEAHANLVKNSTITGSLYCQTGTNNNKACNTSQADPVPIDFPISDANIADWKTDAENGGVTNGDVTVSAPTTLGPRKIIGDLTINNTLTMANTIWVTGNISTSNNITLKLDPSFGATTGIIIADGFIDMANGVDVLDSGTPGSYILLLSTAPCDGGTSGNPCAGNVDAITIRNNSDILIANAQQGTVSFGNNATVKEVTGNKIKVANNATITYGSGVFSVDFTSGPGGGWDILGWKETQ
ncbi:hypothetical protein A3A03_01810 [Candidatus Nomurabacteria bacterium RIFCSPLOWO2_01_FULL_40_18]|uniref:Uncharacterized protein n=1 Tax=Candidatus Nomurabacteria bacterium RIFCSPLOWO2_01_FULL_40_18 TaxID=1801773 RepID=A0A1F6XLU0_9BACT|nr:MAG: hypothetical protein A3A03_01810 [Candidatus Nomurabacteria bacterium RIFCSPLOWO2_01_FULL_40_18]